MIEDGRSAAYSECSFNNIPVTKVSSNNILPKLLVIQSEYKTSDTVITPKLHDDKS